MRMGEANTVAPMASSELSPLTSYATVFSPSPVCLADVRGPLVSGSMQVGASLGRVVAGLRLRMRCGPPGLFGPAQQ